MDARLSVRSCSSPGFIFAGPRPPIRGRSDGYDATCSGPLLRFASSLEGRIASQTMLSGILKVAGTSRSSVCWAKLWRHPCISRGHTHNRVGHGGDCVGNSDLKLRETAQVTPVTNSSVPQPLNLLQTVPMVVKIFSLLVTLGGVAFGPTKKLPPMGFEAMVGRVLCKPTPRALIVAISISPSPCLASSATSSLDVPLLVSHGLWRSMAPLSKEEKEQIKIASGLPNNPSYVTRFSVPLKARGLRLAV